MEAPTKLQTFYQTIQKACLPGVWSKGVTLSSLVKIDSFATNEIILRVKTPDKTVSPKVSLWPNDGDYFCDCGDRADPCSHVAASIAALKNGLQTASPTAENTAAAVSNAPIKYRFVSRGSALHFERWIGTVPLNESLVSLIGGINSGRIARPQIAATQDDFAVDRALGKFLSHSKLDRATLNKLLPALRPLAVELDSQPVQIGTPTHGVHVELRDDGPGFRLVACEDASITEVFENGILRCGTLLRLLDDPGLTLTERKMLSPPGRWFSQAEIPALLSEIIPALEKKLQVRILTRRLPNISTEVFEAPPRIVLNLEKTGEHILTVTPTIVYDSEFSVRDPDAERMLNRKLQSELHLQVGHRVEFRGMSAIDFAIKAQAWETSGEGGKAFAVETSLDADFVPYESGFQLSFHSSQSGRSVDPTQLLRAWKNHETHVPLLGGGYAPLPTDWLNRYGARIQRLIAAKQSLRPHEDLQETVIEGIVPAFLRPELAELSQELGVAVPDPLIALKGMLEDFDKIPEGKLPKDLRAELRHYQQQGVNWLHFLRSSKMGALLADDMGLGKTLQALCAIPESSKGRTLIITPTSVLHSWRDQIKMFRPGLKVSLYYGGNRKFDTTADITLTTYGLLRQDREKLLSQNWDTAILDEAQIIKNPESQVTQAAHLLKAEFRMTLSGTPVENSMEDLWSQLQFLNPGLLGSRREFQEDFATPIARGDENATRRLRTRIRPFILRRLKKDVAPELPPRTEVVLNCELSPSERELYDALLASSQKEVLEKLEEGGSVFGALELLLRLRQACCHPSLVPGQNADTSSKLELLATTLESSIAQGRRALVFSQWTSFLDLIGPRLTQMGVNFLRLDGSTTNREEVVRKFQDPKGPPVMLLSLKAGGVGLTLTAADQVILMDSWWNPAVEDQAADRVHRIGQENPVLICRMITQDTLEEKILELQKRKLQLSNSVLEGSSQAVSLTRADILALLN